jgi:hypothetical protein
MGDTQSVSSLTGKLLKLVEDRIARDKTHIKTIVDYDLKTHYKNKVLEFHYLPPDTVQLVLQKPVTPKQRRYLGCAVVDPDNAGPDGWMEHDICILEPGESKSYPHGAELLVMLKDEKGHVYDCGSNEALKLEP